MSSPSALTLSLPRPPCGKKRGQARWVEGGRGANFEVVVVALRAQLVVAEVALRREVENGERKDAGQT